MHLAGNFVNIARYQKSFQEINHVTGIILTKPSVRHPAPQAAPASAPSIAIISPALADANNGNWRTASRWAGFLEDAYRISLLGEWDGQPYDAIIALHARRSAVSIQAFRDALPGRPIVVVLTGTDLYRDIRTDAAAIRSLHLADRLVVLQEAGLDDLESALRGKTSVIFQSAASLRPAVRGDAARRREVIMIGHLRPEKDPATFMRAAALTNAPRLRMTHVGGALDAALGELAQATQAAQPHYRWVGPLDHGRTRQLLRRSDLMVIASRMEGGAHVIIEAITCGVPVLASDIPGNRGMLGRDYAGYFPVGDEHALARMIDRALAEPAFMARLQGQCMARAALFDPDRERAAVRQMMDNLNPCERRGE